MDTSEIRQRARAVLDRPRSAETLRQYARDYRRLDGEHWYAYAYAHGYAKRSAYKLKAAYQHGTAEHILELLRDVDRARRAGDREQAATARQRATELARELDRADYERQNRFQVGDTAYTPPRPRKRGGKRQSVRSLPEDWHRRLIAATQERDRLPVMVLALTGARPVELEKGIQVECLGEDVRVTVEGAKTGQGHGQTWRRFRITGPVAAELARALRDANLETATVALPGEQPNRRDAFRKRLKTAAQHAGLGPRVSPYTLRHALASQLKAAGLPVEQAAAVLGHSVTQTQSLYGHRTHGGRGGGHAIDAVECAQSIRDTATPPPGERLDVSPRPGF